MKTKANRQNGLWAASYLGSFPGVSGGGAAFSDSSTYALPAPQPRTPRLLGALILGLSLAIFGCSRSTPATKSNVESPGSVSSSGDGSGVKPGPLEVGSQAPEFSVVAHNGEKVSLAAQRGKVVVLYFYPKDGTPGCTVEAEKFRDEHASFTAKNAIVLGVSSDDNASHEKFAEELGLPFLLLPDPDGAIRNAYGVGSFLGIASRETILIDRAGKVAQIYRKVDPSTHADEVLRAIEKL